MILFNIHCSYFHFVFIKSCAMLKGFLFYFILSAIIVPRKALPYDNCTTEDVCSKIILEDCDGSNWLDCREKLIIEMFGVAALPSRVTPDHIIPDPLYAMHGFPGPGQGVGDVSGNSWSNNMTKLIWTVTSPYISLNSTVFHTLNTSGSSPISWPHDGPDMPDPSISPQTIGDTVIIYHNGHETTNCLANFDGVVDYFNELGYDVMEMFLPLYGCNSETPYGEPYDHAWFKQWEDAGDHIIRYFIELLILTINYAYSLGYKHVVLTGLSGGGWVTTLAAAVDPRIKLSIPIAGTVPKWPTALYPYEVPDLPELDGDFEQHYGRSIYKQCGFVCMYVLASLEQGRASGQILHDHDPCCYAAHTLRDEIKHYNKFVQEQPGVRGWMQTFVTAGNIHHVNLKDKVIVSYLVEKLRRFGVVSASDMKFVPFDLLA